MRFTVIRLAGVKIIINLKKMNYRRYRFTHQRDIQKERQVEAFLLIGLISFLVITIGLFGSYCINY